MSACQFGSPTMMSWPHFLDVSLIYRTRAIINRGLYFFYPIFTLAEAYIADSLCTKNENSSFFNLKIHGLYTRAAYDGTRTVHFILSVSLDETNFIK